MKRRPLSLALRLIALIGVSTTLIFLLFGWMTTRLIEQHFSEEDADELRIVAQAIQRALPDSPTGNPNAALDRELAGAVAGHHGVYYYVANPDGKRLYAMSGPDLVSAAARLQPAQRIDADSLHTWKEGLKTYRGVRVSDARSTIVLATTMDGHLRFLASFRRMLWTSTALVCVTAILAAWLAIYQGHSPIRSISRKLRGVTSERLHVRLSPEQVPIELSELVASFNDMLQRIEDGFRRVSNVSADIAHELRTPITNLTTQTQVALSAERSPEEYREILYSSLEEYERMAAMIGDMLFLAQTDHGLLKLEHSQVDLATQVHGLFEYFEAWAEDREVSLLLQGAAPPVLGDRLMIRRALSNLLSNAIRYTPSGRSVTVTLVAGADNVLVRVENPGAEIPPEHLSMLFERFYRVDPSRQRKGDGAGLGLAIVKSIVDAHGGTVCARSAGGITTFQIAMPRAA